MQEKNAATHILKANEAHSMAPNGHKRALHTCSNVPDLAPRAECDNAACGHVEDALHEGQRQLHAHSAIVLDSRLVNHFHMRAMKVVDRHVISRCHHITAPSRRDGKDAGANAKRLAAAVLREHTQL